MIAEFALSWFLAQILTAIDKHNAMAIRPVTK